MNLSIALFLIFLTACAAIFAGRPRLLFFAYPFLILFTPTVRGQLGFPLYLYDVVGALILLYAVRRGALSAWPANRAPWHWIVGATIVLSGIFVTGVRFGPTPESAWITCHTLLAYLQILTGVYLLSRGRSPEANYMAWGIVTALAGLAAVAWLQFGNVGFARFYNGVVYRDLTRGLDVTGFAAQLAASRAAGPFGSPNALGVAALLAAFATWVIGTRRQAMFATLAAVAVIIPTVSRQAYLSVVMALGLYLLLASNRTRLAGLVLLLVTPFIAPLLAFVPAFSSAAERFSRIRTSGLEEGNLYARLVAGPQRLWSLIEQHPDVLAFGAGWDVTKLMVRGGVNAGIYATGYVSNGYLLWLYYAGVAGLLVILAFMLSLFRAAASLQGEARAPAVAITLSVAFLYFADNGPAVIESVIAFIFIIAGGVFAGAATRQPVRRAWNFARQDGTVGHPVPPPSARHT